MKPDLLSEYTLIKSGNKKANAFSKLIKNNEDLKDELHNRSAEITDFYNNPSDIQRLKYIFDDKQINLCECGNPRSWRNFKIGYNKTCGDKKCIVKENNKSVRNFYQKKYGVDHLFQTDSFKSELKDTFITKYGVDNPGKNQEVKDKIKKTNLKNSGKQIG